VTLVLLLASGARAQGPPPLEEEQDVEEIEEIVVTGSRGPRRLGEAPVSVEVIDRAKIEASGSQDVADLLEQHRGVDVQRSVLGASVRLRGLEAEHTLILVDGQRVVGAKDGTIDMSRFSADSIERIEIVKGASSALYGSDALGGVINIITRRSKALAQASITARGGTPASLDTSGGLGVRTKHVGLRLDAGVHGSPSYDGDPATPTTDVNQILQVHVAGNSDWRPSDVTTFTMRGSWSGQDSRGVDEGLGGSVQDRRNLTEDGLFRLGFESLPSERTRVSATLGVSAFRDQFVSDQQNAVALDLYEETRETLVQLTTQASQRWERHTLTVGLEGFTSLILSPRLGPGGGGRIRGAVYAQDEVRVLTGARRWVVVPGARADTDSWFGGAVAPSLGTRFDPSDSVTVRGSVGVGWRAPSFRELLLSFDNVGVGYVVTGNIDLVPESSLATSLGVEVTPTEALSVALDLHSDLLRNLIQLTTLDDDPINTVFGYANIARARSMGAEGSVSWDPTEVFGASVSATVLRAIDLDSGDPLEGRAPVRGTAGIRLRTGERAPRFNARASLVGPRPFYTDDAFGGQGAAGQGGVRQDAPAHALIDARVVQQVRDLFDLFAGVDNALNAGDPRFLPTPPRLLYAGIDARFSTKRRTK